MAKLSAPVRQGSKVLKKCCLCGYSAASSTYGSSSKCTTCKDDSCNLHSNCLQLINKTTIKACSELLKADQENLEQKAKDKSLNLRELLIRKVRDSIIGTSEAKKLAEAEKTQASLAKQINTRTQNDTKFAQFYSDYFTLIQNLQIATTAKGVISAVDAILDKPLSDSKNFKDQKVTAKAENIDKCWKSLPDNYIVSTRCSKAQFDKRRKPLTGISDNQSLVPTTRNAKNQFKNRPKSKDSNPKLTLQQAGPSTKAVTNNSEAQNGQTTAVEQILANLAIQNSNKSSNTDLAKVLILSQMFK